MKPVEPSQAATKSPRRTSAQVIEQAQAAREAQRLAREERADKIRAKQLAKRQQRLAKRQQQLAEQPDAVGGRPPLTEDELCLHAITVRLDARRFQQLSAYAATSGRKLAAVIRAALDEIPQFTTEQHELLRQVPDLVNLLRGLKQEPATPGRPLPQEGQWAEFAGRLDALLTSFRY